MGAGFTRQQLEDYLSADHKNALDGLIIVSLRDPSKLQPAALNFEVLKQRAMATGLTDDQLRNVWNGFDNSVPDVRALIVDAVPEAEIIFQKWNDTPLKSFTLTSVGIAIGHANAARVIGLEAPLNIWIK
jgi:hypothetical protein